MIATATTEALHRQLCALTLMAGADELRVLLDVAHRLIVIGRQTYGELVLEAKVAGKDLGGEALDELRDWVVYQSMIRAYRDKTDETPTLDLRLREALTGGGGEP